MKKTLIFGFVCLTVFSFANAVAEEKVCHRCEQIREYNKDHHQNYEYYEDYLKQGRPTEASIPDYESPSNPTPTKQKNRNTPPS